MCRLLISGSGVRVSGGPLRKPLQCKGFHFSPVHSDARGSVLGSHQVTSLDALAGRNTSSAQLCGVATFFAFRKRCCCLHRHGSEKWWVFDNDEANDLPPARHQAIRRIPASTEVRDLRLRGLAPMPHRPRRVSRARASVCRECAALRSWKSTMEEDRLASTSGRRRTGPPLVRSERPPRMLGRRGGLATAF